MWNLVSKAKLVGRTKAFDILRDSKRSTRSVQSRPLGSAPVPAGRHGEPAFRRGQRRKALPSLKRCLRGGVCFFFFGHQILRRCGARAIEIIDNGRRRAFAIRSKKRFRPGGGRPTILNRRNGDFVRHHRPIFGRPMPQQTSAGTTQARSETEELRSVKKRRNGSFLGHTITGISSRRSCQNVQ